MNPNQTTAFKALQQAQQALKAGDKSTARHFAELAAHSAPELEEVWLMMAALASPHASVEYLQRALQINPASERAQKGMAWAVERLHKGSTTLNQRASTTPDHREQEAQQAPMPPPALAAPAKPQAASVGEKTEPTRPVSAPIEAQPARQKPVIPVPVSHPKAAARPQSPAKSTSRERISLAATLALLTCLVAAVVIAYTASPVSALFAPETHGPAWAQAEISKSTATASPEPTATLTFTPSPTFTPTNTATFTVTPSISPSPTITETPLPSDTPTPTETPSITPTEEASPTPLPTDTALPTRVIPTKSPAQAQKPIPGTGGERWIDVDLSQQMVYAYEGNTLVNSFLVSTGTWQHPTVTGQFRIYIKYRYKDMSGPGYYLPNVPYTMFFYAGYALHGTYWHSNFGTPMSHGCINLTIPDSEWLYNFSSVGTLVNVHY